MNKRLSKRMSSYLNEKVEGTNVVRGNYLPEIRFFDGNQEYASLNGDCRAKTLNGSLELFLSSKGY